MKRRIAIACQGGGSQTAFTAGALQTLFEAGIEDEFEIVSLSGTSGGAVCAALVWYAMRKREKPAWRRLMSFWRDNTAQSHDETFFNDWIVTWVRAINSGSWPTLHLSPASLMARTMMAYATVGQRRTFADLRELLETHIDFAEVASWGPQEMRPVLVLGAANILTGRLRKFVSIHEAIQVEHILASCAVPNIFPAVEIGKDAYWDGLFSDNPPVDELVRPKFVGAQNVAEEIWLIKINPTTRATIPTQVDDILDRRNQLEGNVSLFQQLNYLEMLNTMIAEGAFRPEFLQSLALKEPIRIPKAFADDPDKPYHIPCIEMSEHLQATLDYEGKIDRGSANIGLLIEDGRRRARDFLAARARIVGR